MAVAVRVPLEQLADPTDTTYIPRPEWYFLFLFQTLKLFNGPLEVVGSAVLPGLAVLALILVPFLDRGRMVKVTRRTVAYRLCGAGRHRLDRAHRRRRHARPPEAAGIAQVDYSAPTDWIQLSPEELAGVAYFRAGKLRQLPRRRRGRRIGPDLTAAPIHKDAAWMIQHFKRPGRRAPGQCRCRRSRSATRS